MINAIGKGISTKKNISIGIVLSLFTLVLSLILHVFYTRFLVNSVGDTNYGVYAYALSITNWLTLLSSAVFSAYIRFVTKQKKEHGEEGVAKTNTFFLLLFLLFDIVSALFLCVFFICLLNGNIVYQEKDLLFYLLLISGIQVLFSIPANIFSLYISYQKKHIWIKITNLIATILPPLITIPFLIKGFSIITVLIIQAAVLIFTYFLNFCFAVFSLKEKFIFKKFFFDKETIKQITIFVLFMVMIEVVDRLNATSDKLILGSIENGNYVHLVTVYQLGLSFSEFFASLSIAILTVFIPTIHESVVSENKPKIDKTFKYTYVTQMLLLFLFFGGFVACGREFIHLWKPEHPEIFYIALVLLFIRLVPLSQNSANEVQKAFNKYKFRSIINAVFVAINIAISIVLIYVFGYDQAIWACLIGTVFSTVAAKWIILSIYNDKVIKLDMKSYWLDFLKCSVAVVIAFIPSLLLSFLLEKQGVTSLIRFFACGFLFVSIFSVIILFLFSKIVFEIAYSLTKKKNVLAFDSDEYLTKGIYRIDKTLSILYKNKKQLRSLFSKTVLPKQRNFFKSLIAAFYRNQNFVSHDISGEIIYRSKQTTHIYNFSNLEHYIAYDDSKTFSSDVLSRKISYPISRPKLISCDQSKNIICEQLVIPSKNSRDFDILFSEFSSSFVRTPLSSTNQFKTPLEVLEGYRFDSSLLKERFYSKLSLNQQFYECKLQLYYSHGDMSPGNLIYSDNNLFAVDWETNTTAPLFYDFIHYLIAYYLKTKDNSLLEKYFNGDFDLMLNKMFTVNNSCYNPSFKVEYYYLALLIRLIVFEQKDNKMAEKALLNDSYLLKW